MKFALAATTVASVLSIVSATPTPVTDTDILQYALTLEHLENAFYSGALKKFDAKAFTNAGMPPWARGRFSQVAAHEAQHVALLSGAIGSTATKPCTYKFPYTDPKSFAALSMVLEGVGVSAYLGAASSINNTEYITVAGSILTTEARHQAWVSSAVLKKQPWSAPEDTPLQFSEIYTLAASFITSCPSGNPTLPFTAFPALTADASNARSGTSVQYSFTGSSGPYYAAYFYGLGVTVVELDGNKRATVPAGMLGTYYTVITTDSNGAADDSNTVAGPLISIVDFAA